jgi:hypothetical protein
MKAVVAQTVDRASAARLMGLEADATRATRLIDDLVREGLLAECDGRLSLP